jgi:hypothetical protein
MKNSVFKGTMLLSRKLKGIKRNKRRKLRKFKPTILTTGFNEEDEGNNRDEEDDDTRDEDDKDEDSGMERHDLYHNEDRRGEELENTKADIGVSRLPIDATEPRLVEVPLGYNEIELNVEAVDNAILQGHIPIDNAFLPIHIPIPEAGRYWHDSNVSEDDSTNCSRNVHIGEDECTNGSRNELIDRDNDNNSTNLDNDGDNDSSSNFSDEDNEDVEDDEDEEEDDFDDDDEDFHSSNISKRKRKQIMKPSRSDKLSRPRIRSSNWTTGSLETKEKREQQKNLSPALAPLRCNYYFFFLLLTFVTCVKLFFVYEREFLTLKVGGAYQDKRRAAVSQRVLQFLLWARDVIDPSLVLDCSNTLEWLGKILMHHVEYIRKYTVYCDKDLKYLAGTMQGHLFDLK